MDSSVCIVICIVLSFELAIGAGKNWGYQKTDYGPGDWGKMAPLCSRQHQSPIDINISAAKTEKSYRGLVLNVEQNVGGAVTGSFINNGHVPTFHVNNKKGAVTLNGGPLGKILHILHQFHFHFGCNSSVGSEHRVDGKHFAAEMHLVFYNSLYETFQKAVSKHDGLAVVGVFVQVDGKFSEWMEKIAVSLKNIKRPNGIRYHLGDSIPLASLIPDLASVNAPYFTYKGSLTTPPCYESVQWIVLENPISVTESQLEIMRTLTSKDGNHLCNNFRPVKPLNGRKLLKGPGEKTFPGEFRRRLFLRTIKQH
ncbi:carbonic anhydrase 2-like [Porites lutea]|uniref:carbonic anhydrase 2-like n=1 Tax=Porites lutea TaxID=51062 RepID=UPI003CC5A92E